MTDSHAENRVLVNIYGDEYPITGVSDPPHISRIADFVDAKMKEVAKNSRIAGRDKVAILAAMSIASELHEKTEKLDHLNEQINTQVDGILERLDQAFPGMSQASQ